MRWAPLLAVIALLCLPEAVLSTPHEMLVNGDFEQEITVGWLQRLDASAATLERTTTAQPDPDYELRLTVANGVGTLAALQRFLVPDPGMTVTADLCCSAAGSGGAWSAAGLVLTYRDRDWGSLGQTVIAAVSADCPWVDSPTFHLIAAVPGVWTHHAFELLDELASLPGVDPDRVAWLEVAVLIEADNC
ncbi:MAG: hypothetical protein PVF43_11075 [Candidatus Eiseniibacteriota bacterium]|jgi:hypothetical protein